MTRLNLTNRVIDRAALDDITTDTASSFFVEWLMLIISIPLLSAAGYLLLRHRKFSTPS